ncbi:hypothetical protein OCA8868_03290 [Octadecabacter ascidiaceicola]|uniref:Uncharacterized protein n=2 Tax=Octadecabacter ascidiaceicola TaxID=1655543 RepID=A0A238KRR4_9RHOB|nr:hypothetical protein OCA8868_03290 [Octadecabacter ascidiaceicola]
MFLFADYEFDLNQRLFLLGEILVNGFRQKLENWLQCWCDLYNRVFRKLAVLNGQYLLTYYESLSSGQKVVKQICSPISAPFESGSTFDLAQKVALDTKGMRAEIVDQARSIFQDLRHTSLTRPGSTNE